MFKKFIKLFFSYFKIYIKKIRFSNYSEVSFFFYKTKEKKELISSFNIFDRKVYFQVNDSKGNFAHLGQEDLSRIAFIKSYLKDIKNNIDVYDIGSNYGTYSIGIDNCDNFILVEPNPFCCFCLEKTFKDKNFKIIQKSLGVNSGDTDLTIMPRESGGSSLKENFVSSEKHHEKFIMKTETISINELLNFKNPENSQFFIKLDVEGMDIEVVESFSQDMWLSNYDKGKIMLEIHKGQDLDILVRKFGDRKCISMDNLNFKGEIFSKKYLNNSQPEKVYGIENLTVKDQCQKYKNDLSFLYGDLIITLEEKL